jgi:hypothetical protein
MAGAEAPDASALLACPPDWFVPLPDEPPPAEALAALGALPRTLGSSIIWLIEDSIRVPSERSRLTRTVTFHRFATLPD